MIICIPDDYHGLVPKLDCFRLLERHDVCVFREAEPPFDVMARNLRDAEIVVPIRERTRFTRALIEAMRSYAHRTRSARRTARGSRRKPTSSTSAKRSRTRSRLPPDGR